MRQQAKNYIDLLSPADYIPQRIISDNFNLLQISNFIISLNNKLQSSLELNKILIHFSDAVRSLVPFEGFIYEKRDENYQLLIGKNYSHALSYQITYQDKFLGMLRISKSTKFSEEEIVLTEYFISYLVMPLKNSLDYGRVLKHSLYDTITEVSNRAAFNDEFKREINLAERHDLSISLLMIDVDNFKIINDNYGHAAGDYVLHELCRVLEYSLRQTDKIYRYGGEEFTVLLNETGNAGATMLAERARKNVELHRFKYKQQNIKVTISIGIATRHKNETPENLFERADTAVYKAKKTGKNRICNA